MKTGDGNGTGSLGLGAFTCVLVCHISKCPALASNVGSASGLLLPGLVPRGLLLQGEECWEQKVETGQVGQGPQSSSSENVCTEDHKCQKEIIGYHFSIIS